MHGPHIGLAENRFLRETLAGIFLNGQAHFGMPVGGDLPNHNMQQYDGRPNLSKIPPDSRSAYNSSQAPARRNIESGPHVVDSFPVPWFGAQI